MRKGKAMEKSKEILSDIIVYSKYAKYVDELQRRETWEEIVYRNIQMMVKKFPKLEKEIYEAYSHVLNKEILMSMRSAQFAGLPIEINNARLFNCSYAPIDHVDVFSEAMFLLLSGCGFSYSVQFHHIENLPEIKGPSKRKRNYLINDSIIGWADAIKVLIHAYFYGKSNPVFDYRDIRPKGSRLITSGGKAPGPQPLKDCIHNIRKVLDKAIEERGLYTNLKSIELHDIMCFIADSVLSGGIRRSACLCGFSYTDEDMLSCKSGNWYETNPQRQRSNNSVVLSPIKLTKESFDKVFDRIKISDSGEPGIIISADKNMMFNPCGEASLSNSSFCNLTTINMSGIKNQDDFEKRSKAASFIGTLQAAFTDFHYLRDIWRRNTEKDALLGVSMTGIADNNILNLNFENAAKVVLDENERVAKLIGINKASRTTLVKPEGTASSLLGTSSGIHSWHSQYYVRRMRLNKDEALYLYLKETIPDLIEDEYFKPHSSAVLSLPIKSPEGAITRDEGVEDFIDRCLKINSEWIKQGHRSGANTHNVSATIAVRDDEWELVRKKVWENINRINGMSFLKYDGNVYPQMPFEECTEEVYNSMMEKLQNINLKDIVETSDETDLKGEVACGAGGCQVNNV
jgi:ribonucleoside-triphosphate reductase